MEDVMAKLFPCLWFDGNAEEAATFYATLLPDSHVDGVWRSPAETPSGPAGMVMTVDFTLAGQQLQGLNGGPEFKFNEAVSFVIDCDDQAEVDRLWDALTASGEPGRNLRRGASRTDDGGAVSWRYFLSKLASHSSSEPAFKSSKRYVPR